MRTFRVTEASTTVLDLTESQAAALTDVGSRLVGTSIWWGKDPDKLTEDHDRAVIRCTRAAPHRWNVRVGDVIGLVVLADMQIVVEPKIPTAHLVYLLQQGGYSPRVDSSPRGGLDRDTTLWDLVCTWYLTALEHVLRVGLVRDYQPVNGPLAALRGRVSPLQTARDIARGRVQIHCDYESFDIDNPANRVLKAAAVAISSSPASTVESRQRAVRSLARLADVDSLGPADDSAVVLERRSQHYSSAIHLARNILRNCGRFLRAGDQPAWGFLIPTPRAVEAGMRVVLQRRLGESGVRKAQLDLPPTKMTLNPDLRFSSPPCIADVKYKNFTREWRRADMYQLVAFATGFRTERAALLGFSSSAGVSPEPVAVGPVSLAAIAWVASPDLDPGFAADDFVRRVEAWLYEAQG